MMKALVAIVFAMMLPIVAHAIDINGCGQVVPSHQTGVLQVDLTSCASSAVGVFVDDSAELDLNGHAIASGLVGVQCTARHCTVRGPGEIRNTALYGIWGSFQNARLRIEDVNAHDNAIGGIVASSGSPRLALKRVSATGNAVGIETIFRGRIAGEDVDASNNRSNGIVAGARFHFKRLTLLNTGASDPHPEDDGLVCLDGGGAIVDSTVTGSAGADLATAKRPRVINSSCGTSRFIDPGGPTWGVCSND